MVCRTLPHCRITFEDCLIRLDEYSYLQVVSKIYYSAPRVTLKLVFLNSFKMGVVAALIADAFKLAG